MILFPKGARHFVRLLVAFRAFALGQVAATETRWVGTWATAPLAEPADKGKRSLAGATLRQVGHVSLGGGTLRVRFSNAFDGPVRFRCVAHLWRSRPPAGRSSRVPTGRSEAGEWRHLRWLNGDQTHQGRHVRLNRGASPSNA